MYKNKIITLIAALVIFVIPLSACTQKNNLKSDKLNIVCTVFPVYDWVKNIAGDRAEVFLLSDNGADMHSFQPSADDMIKLYDCDLFLYVGGESDYTVKEFIKKSPKQGRRDINLLNELGTSALKEEKTEGMQDNGEEEEDAYDEHIWLSLKNAALLTDSICSALSEIDGENADFYKANADGYKNRLNSLDKKYAEAFKEKPNKTLLFADRFPFRYLLNDYGLSYYAAFAGCSAESEASFQTVAFLSRKTEELKLMHILTLNGSDKKLADTVIKNTADKNADILTLNSMETVSKDELNKGTDYIGIMENNLSVIEKALETRK